MALFRSQRERIAETDRLELKPKAPVIAEPAPPTPPQRSPLRNSPINAHPSPTGLRPPTSETEDRSSTIWILYDEYNANRSDSEPSLHSTEEKKTPNPVEVENSEDPESRRTSISTVSLSNFRRFLEQPEDSPYDTNELNERLQRQLERMAARRSWDLSGIDSRIPQAKYTKVDQSEADLIRSMPTTDEPRPPTPKKVHPRDDGKDTVSSESASSHTAAYPGGSTPARRIVIPTSQPEPSRVAPLANEPTEKPKTGNLDVSVPLRGESMVASLHDLFPASNAQAQNTGANALPPRSFIPNGARLPIQPAVPQVSSPQMNKGLPSSSSPPQHMYLQNSPPMFPSLLPSSPPTFYHMQQGSPPAPTQFNASSPPLPPVPAPSGQSYTPPTKQNYLQQTMPRDDQHKFVPVQQPQMVVSPGSPPRVGPSPTQPRLAQLQVGQRLSPEEYRQVLTSQNVLSSPETLVASSSDYDSSTPYSSGQRKDVPPAINVLDAKWPSRDPTVIKMQRRNAGIVGPSSYTPPEYLTKIQEEDITEQKPVARKPEFGGARTDSGGSDRDVKVKGESRGRSRVRGDEGTARVRSSHRDSPPPKLARGVTVTSGMSDFTSIKTSKGGGHVRVGDERKQKRQELVRKRRRDVFALKAAVLISVLNLLLVDALLVVWLVKGGVSTIFGKA